ncbi:endonuclease MutS2 [Virgibacillus sp. W0430]|uniref:endonuclease MutS2 n=1 Tax=Virgibacillus sp. W0430 TaxID=3391580 RepID=UPI003F457D92
MNERMLRVLEFNKITEQLSNEAATSVGKELSLRLTPNRSLKAVQKLQDETDEAVTVLRLNLSVPFGGITDIRPSLKRSVIGGVLNPNECLEIANTIYGGRKTKQFIEKIEADISLLKELIQQIDPLQQLEQQIKKCIDDQANVLDQASPKLQSIRSSIRTYEARIREKLNSYIRTKSKLLSDAIITIRNERYVLPVKHEHRSSFGGIVHDQSSSGQTLFMEPNALVELNNELQAVSVQEEQEIQAILYKLTEQIAEQQDTLYENVKVLGEADFIFARARLAQKMKAAMPKINDAGIIKMKQARHPLIPHSEVVANDIEIGNEFHTIVITGPNTGGKTVTLKMVGLCTLMAQSGLQIPALDGCELSVFDHVFADIGDEQSIEQNLSTFSSHMTNIVSIMDQVNDQSLVLFDELGAGTDPQEGAALAMSILDEAMEKGARVIATTHYPELKAYGYNRDKVINASVEFDVESLQPTYRLLIGVPGRSNAFEISTRLGLKQSIIERAKNHIGIDSKSVESMISALEQSKRQAIKEYEDAHNLLLESEKLKADLEQKWKQFDEQREALYKKTEEKAEKALTNAREQAETIVKEMRLKQSNSTMKEHEWIEAKRLLDTSMPRLSNRQADNNVEHKDEILKELQKNDEVLVKTFNQQGTILEKISSNEYFVQVGMMKLKIQRQHLKPLKKETTYVEKQTTPIKSQSLIKPQLDVRGLRYEEAMHELEKYLDNALLSGFNQVTIIHGKGTGALRKGVLKNIENHPHISSYRVGSMNEGGSGVTIAEIK